MCFQMRYLPRNDRASQLALIGGSPEVAKLGNPHKQTHRFQPVHCCHYSNKQFAAACYVLRASAVHFICDLNSRSKHDPQATKRLFHDSFDCFLDFNAGKYAPYVSDDVRIDIALEASKE